ncbi:porin [Photobacterium aphoticum]|uniref:Membrane protein n=1 Tax=Photobacterium aphoticum TaxID=754436 RepID=A0A0J1GRD7_9GAMM|nr:porin [Photobacterium aphoticum]KLV02280.1 membrane protein [Photobacterium aphoticum]PSU57737.1 porin [Photobacterium aphoticum]
MNKNKHLSLVLALLPAPLFAQTPPADSITVPMPTVYGDIRAQAAWHQDKDYTTDIYQATVGAIGNLGYQDLKVRYQLEAEYSESEHSADKDNDLIVREANIITMLPPWGGLYIGSGTTGTWADLYSKVDIFESNNMERHSDNLLFGGKRYATNQLAYMTPWWGGFQFKVAVVSPNDSNNNDADIIGLRALYKQDNFSLVVNHSWTDKVMLPAGTEQDSQRTLIAISYQWADLYLGAVAELDYDAPYGERQVYGVSAKYTYGNTAFSLGAQYADWNNAAVENEVLGLANVRHDLNKHLAVFAEGALYSKDKPTVTQGAKSDNVNLGLIVSF